MKKRWIIGGGVTYLAVLVFAWALCVVASDDEMMVG